MNALDIFANVPEDASPEDVEAYLKHACGSDSDLRDRVDALIGSNGQIGEFMELRPLGESSSGIAAETAGSIIGNYKLLQEIGHGGFGVVYMAEQLAPVRRRVALKIIKLGMDTKTVVARFEVERQALAMMDHPNIAKVHDAGATETGRPYFVMELVRGISITKFCEDQQLDTKATLALFMDVCSAIQHAHQKGIIHRDLKPSNIIVTLHDDKAVPKVIDFGVAKATQQDLTDKTLFTQFEQFIGTPAYMSPEQAQMSGLDIDTRSDIYALGVLLYELLTGTTPFDAKTLAQAGHDEIRRIIREEDPPKPSTRLTELQKRSVSRDPVILANGAIDQELDWIVMKALEKDRTRRYETANGLAADIVRHLNHEPVTAGAPSSAYRVKKFARKHRRSLITAAIISTILVVGSVVSLFLAISASRSSRLANEASRQATAKEQEAERGRIESQLLFADQQLTSGKTAIGVAYLTRLIRQSNANEQERRIATERLFATMRQQEFPRLLQVFDCDGRAEGAALSADGNLVVTANGDGTAQVRDTATGNPIGRLMTTSNDALIEDVSFSPNGNHVLLTTNVRDPKKRSSTVYVWDWRQGEKVCEPLTLRSISQASQFSPDGKLVLVGTPVLAQVWRIETGEPRFDPPIRRLGFKGTFSPDSQRLLFTGVRTAKLYDARTGHLLRSFPHDRVINSVRFRFDGQRVVTSSSDGTARVWDVVTGELLNTLHHHDLVNEAKFSSDGSLIATASSDGTAKMWEAETGQLLAVLPHDGERVKSVHFNAKAQLIITTSMSGNARAWPIQLGSHGSVTYSEASFGQNVHLSDDGRVMLSAAAFGTATLWRIEGRQPESQLFRHAEDFSSDLGKFVWSAHFSHDGNRLVTASIEGNADVWDAWTGEKIIRLPHQDNVRRAAFSPDDRLILTASSLDGLSVWDAHTGKNLLRVDSEGELGHAAFSPSKDEHGHYWVATVATGTSPATLINLGDPGATTALPHDLAGYQSQMNHSDHRAMFSQDGNYVVTATDDGSARVWSVPDGKLLRELKGHSNKLCSAFFSPDGNRVLTASRDGTARLWDRSSGNEIRRFQHPEAIAHAVFNPRGDRVLTASWDGTARIWDSATGEPVGLTLRHGGAVVFAWFSSDGRRVVTASADGTARIWDAQTGHALSNPLRHDGLVLWAQFSPDGRRVVTSGDDTTARIWDHPPLPDGPIPTWLADWAEAVVGMRLDEKDNVTPLPPGDHRRMESFILSLPDDRYYAKTAKWFYQDKASRLITPFSKLTVSDWVENRIKENTLTSLEEAIGVDPDHPVALANLARLLQEEPHCQAPGNLLRAKHLIQRAVDLASENSEWKALRVRIKEALENDARLARALQLEARAASARATGDFETAKDLRSVATTDRILTLAESDWPTAVQRGEVLKLWRQAIEAEHPPIELIKAGATWSYFDAPNSDPPIDWNQLDADDHDWATGSATLGFADNQTTELKNGRIAYYFRHRFTISELNGHELTLRLLRDDGAVVYLNGKEVIRSNMPGGEIEPQTLAASNVGGSTELQYFHYHLNADLLHPGTNLVAVEVHQDKPGSSDISFDLSLSAGIHAGEQLADWIERQHPKSVSELDLEQRTRLQWMLGQHDDVLTNLDRLLADLPDSSAPQIVRQRKEWQRRKADAFEAIGRRVEATALRERAVTIPMRAPDRSPNQIDIASYYTQSLFEPIVPAPHSFTSVIEHLAETFNPNNGPDFDIRGRIVLNSGVYAQGKGLISGKDFNTHSGSNHPSKVTIAIGQKAAAAVHFLQSCHQGNEAAGVEVAHYWIHFADNTKHRVPVIYGKDIVNHTINGVPARELGGVEKFAWKQSFSGIGSGTAALTLQTWQNSYPDKIITQIDFVSAEKMAAPFLVGITLE